MKTRIRTWRNRSYYLVVDEPGTDKEDAPTLAVLSNYEGTGLWSLQDVRLHPYHRIPSKYLELAASTVNATAHPRTEAERDAVKQMLRDYKEQPDGSITWCSWQGLVPGRPAIDVCGRESPYHRNDPPMFHAKSEGMEHLRKLQAFWSEFEGSVKDAFKHKIPHSLLQPTESQVMSNLVCMEMDEEDQQVQQVDPTKKATKIRP